MSNNLKDMSNEELWKIFPIILKPHNLNYKKWYKQEKNKLSNLIGERNLKRISHIGSTYIKDLVAKPSIDILLEIDKLDNLDKLENNEYICLKKTDDFKKPCLMCMKGYTSKGFLEKVFHLHIRLYNNHKELYFRDYLKNHSEIAKKYGDLKIVLANKYKNHRDNYTLAKSKFINKYTNLAMNLYKNRYKPIDD